MVPFMNALDIKASCVGNHDFDHGLAQFGTLRGLCNFPWLATNMRVRDSGECYGGCAEFVVHEVKPGLKVGFIGLIEHEWVSTLVGKLDVNQIVVEDAVQCALRFARLLRQQHGCSLVVAITHQREGNDAVLALGCKGELDLILGGHDHHVVSRCEQPDSAPIVKAGSDFRWISEVEVYMRASGPKTGLQHVQQYYNPVTRLLVVVQLVEVTRAFDANPLALTRVQELISLKARRMEHVLALATTDIDARSSVCRTTESALGDFLCDVMAAENAADMALINGGSIRSDKVYHAGPVRVETVLGEMPCTPPELSTRRRAFVCACRLVSL